ncbi:hypothetical protein EYF80_066135 [Liparis tanakae]|uniref:Uncharacterized protein n=1 Tax=Liparis tanakae TaxID=230148 RepID=A0A4Z2E520_9TELE|nr:hypothetical protein EYF80_066135 [Liparis tanakae]
MAGSHSPPTPEATKPDR